MQIAKKTKEKKKKEGGRLVFIACSTGVTMNKNKDTEIVVSPINSGNVTK